MCRGSFSPFLDELQGVGPAYLYQVHCQVQSGDESVEQQAVRDSCGTHRERHIHLHLGQVQEQQEDQSGEYQPQKDGACHDTAVYDQALPEHHDAYMLLLQPQYAVESQLFLAPLDQEAVGVIEERHHDDSQQPEAYVDQYQGIDALGQVVHDIVLQYQVKDEVGEHGKGADADVREIGGSILADVGDRYPGQQRDFFLRSVLHIMLPPLLYSSDVPFPRAALSGYPISSGTFRHRSVCRDRFD